MEFHVLFVCYTKTKGVTIFQDALSPKKSKVFFMNQKGFKLKQIKPTLGQFGQILIQVKSKLMKLFDLGRMHQ